MPRIQSYVDEKTHEKLSQLAAEKGLSLSRYLSDLVTHSLSEDRALTEKTHQLLGYILSCVLDDDLLQLNAPKVKRLIKKIDAVVQDKLADLGSILV